MLIPNYTFMEDDEDLRSWLKQQVENNLMPMPDFAYLYLHRNSRTDNLCNIKALHKLMAEQEKGLRDETPSVRDLLMRNTPVMVNGLFASPYYTAVITDYYLNDTDPAPFKRIFARKPVMYCPLCAKEDEEEFLSSPHLRSDRPVYRVRVPHQVEGVAACYRHGVLLTSDPNAEAVPVGENEIRTAQMVYALYKAGCVGSIDDLMEILKEKAKKNEIKDQLRRSFGPGAPVMSLAAQLFEPEELIGIYRKNEEKVSERAVRAIRMRYPGAGIISCDHPLITYQCACGQEHTVYAGSAVLGTFCPADEENSWEKRLLYRSRFCTDPRFELLKVVDDTTGMIRHKDCGSEFPVKLRLIMGGNGFTCPVCARQRLDGLVGQKHVMNCGLEAEITAARSVVDIDVEFEDGRVRRGVVYRNFLDGSIIPDRFYQDLHIGKKRTMNCGLEAEIIASYKKDGRDLIDVRFEDGTEKTGITYAAFKTGRLEPDGYRKSKAAEAIVGQWRMMNCGIRAKVILCRGYDDCDVEFEDGSVRRGVRRDHFLNGELSPEGFYLPKAGEERVMRNSLTAKIIAVRSSADIDVQFENGEVRTGIQYTAFRDGYVRSLVLEEQRKNSHIGEVYLQNCGVDAEVTAYTNAFNCTVRFSNGEVRERVIYSKLKEGSVLPPSLQNVDRVGEKHMQGCGQEAEITAYRDANDVDVKFPDGKTREHVAYYDIVHGRINPLKRGAKFREEHLGEERVMKCGLKAKIIAVRGAMDIDVQFETGEVREHIVYANFKTGGVSPTKREW